MTRPQIPLVNEILAEGYEAATTLRPTIVPHLAQGRYGDIFAGWKAQCTLALARLADEAACARVPLAEGKALVELLASEFDTVIAQAPEYAIGHVVLARTKGAPGPFEAGLIRPGTRFRRPANPHSLPRATEAYYASTEPVFTGSEAIIGGGGTGPVQRIKVRMRATQPGRAANVPRNLADPPAPYSPTVESPIVLADAVFDPAFRAVSAEAAGGSDGPTESRLRAIAQALSVGKYGPTASAITAGLLLSEGVAKAAVKERLQDGTVLAWIADESWASSEELRASALQNLRDKWLGFGCKAKIGVTSNVPISVTASVLLRDKRYAAETIVIADAVRMSLMQYFSGRADWYTWSYSGVRAAIARADRRILSVPRATIQWLDGTAVAEPAQVLPDTTDEPLMHYDIDQTNVTLMFFSQ